MSEHATKREKRLAMLVVAAVVLVTVLLIVETFRLLLPGLWSAFSAGDEQALSEYLASQGRLRSFLTLWFLAVVQVLSLVIPAMPVQLAAGLAYGPWMGFLTSFSASAVANMSVYLIARRLVPVIRRLVADNPKAAKLLDSVRSSKDPWFYTILAFITPGLPNGIIPYAAANAGMRPKQFLAAIFISLLFPTLLTLAPPLIFALGSGWALGRLQPRLLYVWMLAPFVCSALPLPEALGLWDGSFFTEYPLTLGKLDPAFSAPAVVVLAQCISLAAGVVLLVFQFERIGRICKGKTPS